MTNLLLFFFSRSARRRVLPGAVAASALVFLACATDNGDSLHGPQFGPPPERPDGDVGDDGALQEGGPTPDLDGGTEAGDGAMPPPCTDGTVAVLAGDDTTLSGAVQIKGGAWTGAAIAGGAAKSAPSLVAFGTGFVGLTRGASDALQAVTYTTSWSAAAAVGTLTTIGTPALTVVGTKAEAVFLSGAPDTNKFFRIENSGASWSPSTNALMPPAGTASFGPSAGTVAAAGTDLVFAQDGENEGLYTQTWNGSAWSVAAPITGAGTLKTASPALVATDGTRDLLLLYPDNTANHVIGYATRDAATKAWSNGQVTHADAQTAERISVARLSATSVLVTFRGNNQRPYFMTGTLGGASIAWSAPAALLADTSTVDSAPAVAKGVCGDDAIAVFASAGQIKAIQRRGSTWTVPGTIPGASGSRVSVTTR
jgi:hypothetical protein